MGRCGSSALAVALAMFLALAADGAWAEPKIGSASTTRNRVDGIIADSVQALSSGSDVFLNERVQTGDASQAQLVFLDATNLGVGPKSEVKLDRFVYDPDRRTGQVVLETGRGVFRFVTGSQDPKSYTIKTPIASIGVRGTDFHLLVERDRIVIVLVSGALRIVTSRGRVVSLTSGMGVTIFANGRVEGPTPRAGPTIRYARDVPFPYFGSDWTVATIDPLPVPPRIRPPIVRTPPPSYNPPTKGPGRVGSRPSRDRKVGKIGQGRTVVGAGMKSTPQKSLYPLGRFGGGGRTNTFRR